MPQRYRLALRKSAARDLAAIYEFGYRQWGEERADLYYDMLLKHFDQLCGNPYLYPSADHIRPGYRRSLCGVHSIFYRVSETAVEVMAIIGRQEFRET